MPRRRPRASAAERLELLVEEDAHVVELGLGHAVGEPRIDASAQLDVRGAATPRCAPRGARG